MGQPGFWDNNERAQKHIGTLNSLKRSILPVAAFRKKLDDLDVMLELIEGAAPSEQDAYTRELVEDRKSVV